MEDDMNQKMDLLSNAIALGRVRRIATQLDIDLEILQQQGFYGEGVTVTS